MKKIDAERYRILCEKEELISFMADYAPYAAISRITSGGGKGKHAVSLCAGDFPNAPYITGCWQEENNKEIFEEQVKNLCAAWPLGKAEIRNEWTRQTGAYITGIVFDFDPAVTAFYTLPVVENSEPEAVTESVQAVPEAEMPEPVPGGRFCGYATLDDMVKVMQTGTDTHYIDHDKERAEFIAAVLAGKPNPFYKEPDKAAAARKARPRKRLVNFTKPEVMAVINGKAKEPEAETEAKSRKVPARRAPKPILERYGKPNGALTGWTSNRLGTR